MRLVAYFTVAERRLFAWSRWTLREIARYAAIEGALAPWRDDLAQWRGARLTIVLDLPGEEFREETIPRLPQGDRWALLERRLVQRFPETALAAALRCDGTDSGRAQERWLLASIAGARTIEPWILAARAARVKLHCVTSTALLSPSLAQRCFASAGEALILSVHATGLRECYLQRGGLRFARFDPQLPADAEAAAPHVRAEADQLLAYLATLRQPPADHPRLPVLVVASESQHAAIERALGNDRRLDLQPATVERCRQAIGLREALPRAGAEQLFLALAADHPPRTGFARPEERMQARRAATRRTAMAASACGFIACAAIAGVEWNESADLREQARALRSVAQQAEQRAAAATESRDLPTSAENLRATVAGLRRVAEAAGTPDPAFRAVSRALEACPVISLEGVVWSAPAEAGPQGAVATPTQTLEVAARVSAPAAADLRAANAQVGCLVSALQSDGSWQVIRTQSPVDLASTATLRGGEATAPPAGQFTMVLGWKGE